MRSSPVRFLLALGLSLAASLLPAQVAGGTRYALVIGNGDYAELPRLANPANDARDMAAALKELGFSVTLLVDADLGSMEDAVIGLGGNLALSADSMGFFFFAGHGVQSGGVNYLIPADARIPGESFLRAKALAAQTVLDTLADSHNALNVVVLDACRDNPFGWGRGGSRGLSVVGAQPTGSIVAYATGSGSIAQDGQGRNGVFTAELLKQLMTPGIDINEVFRRTGRAVQAATAGRQVPALYSQFFDTAYLAGAAAAPASPPEQGLRITRAWGSVSVSAASAGELYLDGAKLADLAAGAKASLDAVAVGEHRLEMRYPGGQVERLSAAVEEGRTAAAAFVWKPAESPAGRQAFSREDFAFVPGGSFLMGPPADRRWRLPHDGKSHQVSLSAFEMARNEVTFDEYDEFCRETGRELPDDPGWGRGRRPVVNVSWLDCVEYCNWRSAQQGLEPCYAIRGEDVICDFQAGGYRLPTEAEWEYAAAGGPGSRGLALNAQYAGSSNPEAVAWYKANALRRTHPVGEKAPNALGLFDMAGNVWEWCWDRFEGSYYERSPAADPVGPAEGGLRIIRGGGWGDDLVFLRSANRGAVVPDSSFAHLGFRLARGLAPAEAAERAARIASAPLSVREDFVLVPSGSFLMGSPEEEEGRDAAEGPRHELRLSAFEMCEHEVTQAEWAAVMAGNPSGFRGDRLPVECVTWYECLAYCNARSVKEGLRPCYSVGGETDPAKWGSHPSARGTPWDDAICDFAASGYRLPTEAEWEYAAKGGPLAKALAPSALYAGSADLDSVSWHAGNAGNGAHQVGEKRANALGLFDMAGNVWEWCWDSYDKGYYARSPARDPRGPAAGDGRVCRGGSWIIEAQFQRSSCRMDYDPRTRFSFLGFRVVRRP